MTARPLLMTLLLALSLLGAADTGPWAWNGRQRVLRDQIHKSIVNTMRGEEPAARSENLDALEAYVRSLTPPPSLTQARGMRDAAAIERGRRLFQNRGCAECHRPPTYTSRDAYDVGLADERGGTDFNPPSLRGVSQRQRYFHDNRAARLADVFRQYQHGVRELSDDELRDLLAFLNSL